MSMFKNLEIPTELLPKDGRFGCGPSLVRPDFVQDLGGLAQTYMGTSHRQPGVKDRICAIKKLLASYLAVPTDYTIAMGIGGATLVWDMITFSLIDKKAMYFTCGEFSNKAYKSAAAAKFVEAAKTEAPVGEAPLVKEQDGFDVHCLAWNETSTGVMAPELPKMNKSLLAVDATSAAGCLRANLADIDLFYFSPQKAFGSDGGLWIGVFSPRCIQQIRKIKESGRFIPPILDLTIALDNSEKNQTYNTPALATLYFLERQLEWLNEKGIATIETEQLAKSKMLDDWIDSRPELSQYVPNPKHRSISVKTINMIPEIPYQELTQLLRKQGIKDIDCYRKLGENQLRISLFPNVTREDLEKLTLSINYLLDNRS